MKKGELDLDQVRSVIEAVLVTADTPVTPGRLTALFAGLNGKDIRDAVDFLNEGYEKSGKAFTIVEIGGGFQLASRQEYGPWVRSYHGGRDQVRLSQAALETLSIVAFKQPITRVEIDGIRGVNSSGVIRHLHEHGLVRVSGRSEGIGKPMLFGTTREFLLHFGLKSLADLPKPRELEELLAERYPDAAAEQQQATVETAAGEGTKQERLDPTEGSGEDERSQETTTTEVWSQQDAFVEERNRKAEAEGAFGETSVEEDGLHEEELADG